MNLELHDIIHETIMRFVSGRAEILRMQNQEISHGVSAVALQRHIILLEDGQQERTIQLISKKAALIERRVMDRLQAQGANVPFNCSMDLVSQDRAYLCMQDIDCGTDYGKLDMELLQSKEQLALAHIHSTNYHQLHEWSFLPLLSKQYISRVLQEKWGPSWHQAIKDAAFVSQFAHYIPDVERSAARIVEDIEKVLQDEGSHTLVHNDLHPGNTLVYQNQDVFFIDWEEAHYGSLYLDVALRFREAAQAENYRTLLQELGLNISQGHYRMQCAIASRYLGLRYMAWFLNTWKEDHRWQDELEKYLHMAVL